MPNFAMPETPKEFVAWVAREFASLYGDNNFYQKLADSLWPAAYRAIQDVLERGNQLLKEGRDNG